MTDKNTYTNVGSLHNSAWRSAAEESLICSEQFVTGLPGAGLHDSQACSSAIPVIFLNDIAMKPGLSTCITESSGAMGNQDGFSRFCGRPKVGSTSAADLIAEIKRIWAHGPASTLALARAVAAAKNLARHGEWQKIWKVLPFSRRKADVLAAIGTRLDWVNWQTFAILPVGWSILYELSKLKRPAFEEFVRLELIHPGLKLCEARKLVAESQSKMGKAKSPQSKVRERLRRFEEFVDDTLHGWTAGERELARAALTQLTERIDQPSTFALEKGFCLKTTRRSSDALTPSVADSQTDHFNSFHNL